MDKVQDHLKRAAVAMGCAKAFAPLDKQAAAWEVTLAAKHMRAAFEYDRLAGKG